MHTHMGEPVVETRSVADGGLVEEGQVNGDALGDVVVAPVAMASALDGDAPVTAVADRRQGLDGLGDLGGVLGLQDAPRLQGLGRAGPPSLKGRAIVAVGPRGKQKAVPEPGL